MNVAVRFLLLLMVRSTARAFSAPRLSAILFDIDGTLVNSDPIHLAVFRELLLEIDGFNDNKPIDEEFFRANISGRQNAIITADFFPDWSIDERERWSIRKEARFREMAESTMMESKMPGLDRVKNWLEANDSVRKAAVTNAPRLNAEAIIRGIGYDGWFDALVIGDECERPKPDPCPYLTACKLIGTKPQDCVVFEDSPSGAAAGKEAGAFVIGVLSGQDGSTLQDAGCNMLIKDFNDPILWRYLETRAVVADVRSRGG